MFKELKFTSQKPAVSVSKRFFDELPYFISCLKFEFNGYWCSCHSCCSFTKKTGMKLMKTVMSLSLGSLGVQIRNMKMDFNTGSTWHWIGQWTLMMKIYDLFFIGLSLLVVPYNNIKNHHEDGLFFTYYYMGQLNNLAE